MGNDRASAPGECGACRIHLGALETMTYPQQPAERPDRQPSSSYGPPPEEPVSGAFPSDVDPLAYKPPPPYPATSEMPVFKPVTLPPPAPRRPAGGVRNSVIVAVIIGIVVLACIGLGIAGIFFLTGDDGPKGSAPAPTAARVGIFEP
jgi:hypothetical protein